MLRKSLSSFIDLILYGHFWIAAGALAMTLQTSLLVVDENIYFSSLNWFIACGTLGIYALHRLVALKVVSVDRKGRFFTIFQHQKHIAIYAVLAFVSSAFFFFQLSFSLQKTLVAPCLLALAYVIPLANGKRLRDLPFIKIFLIAIAWAWITVIAPAHGSSTGKAVLFLLFSERMAFIFAITIPFDIRDLEMDSKAKVPTIPGVWGVKKAKKIAYLGLALMVFCSFLNTYLGFYSPLILISLLLSASISASLIHLSSSNRHDYFYSGLLDGMMVLQFLLVWGVLLILQQNINMKFLIIPLSCLALILMACDTTKPTIPTESEQWNPLLHDIWVLSEMDGKKINNTQKRPRLELFPDDHRMGGNGGCNKLFGNLVATEKSINFSKIGSTKMYCANEMTMESEFIKTLSIIDHYHIKNLKLYLSEGKKTRLIFQKVD